MTLARNVTLIGVLLAWLAAPAWGQFSRGVEAYQRGDYDMALKEFRKSAEREQDAGSQLFLGMMYAKGQGVKQNYPEAVRWFSLAAEQGHAGAQFQLGLSYVKGEGVPQDYNFAAKWYRLAADQGNNLAQVGLGMLYRDGLGVARDYVQAYMWFTVCCKDSKQAVQELKSLSRNMTPKQIAEAQRLAQEWKSQRTP